MKKEVRAELNQGEPHGSRNYVLSQRSCHCAGAARAKQEARREALAVTAVCSRRGLRWPLFQDRVFSRSVWEGAAVCTGISMSLPRSWQAPRPAFSRHPGHVSRRKRILMFNAYTTLTLHFLPKIFGLPVDSGHMDGNRWFSFKKIWVY